MEFKNFMSLSGPLRIADTSGHTAILTDKPTSLPAAMWGQAYALGAISEDMKSESMKDYLQDKAKEIAEQKEKELTEIKESLLKIYDNPIGYVDKKNNLIVRKALTIVNKPVKKDVLDQVWAEILAEKSEEV